MPCTQAKGDTGNPAIIHFLERDISLVARNTGASNGNLRNRIRDSFKQPNEMRDVKFCYHGQEIDGSSYTGSHWCEASLFLSPGFRVSRLVASIERCGLPHLDSSDVEANASQAVI